MIDVSSQHVGCAEVSNAWKEAVRVARVRDELRAHGLDGSVREVARAAGCSHGRAGELLQIRDAFSRSDLVILGKGDAVEGEGRLSKLSFRQLRRLLTRSTSWSRIMAVREIDGDQQWTD
jgi:hypothetical protein